MSDKDALCAKCGAHLENWHGTLGEHDCKTDLFGPLRPPRGVEEPALVRCNKADICRARCTTHVDPHEWTSYCDVPCTRKAPGNGGYCEPVPQPAPAKSYVCNEAGECGIAECTAAEAHTHNEPPLHGPRECGFTHQVVQCEEVGAKVQCDTRLECGNEDCSARVPHDPRFCMPGGRHYCVRAQSQVRCNPVPIPEPLRGVWVWGKALEVLSQYQDWSNDRWDAFWATVTGKTTRSTDAKRVMREANGPGVRELVYWDDVRDIILGALDDHDVLRSLDLANRLADRIVKLPRPETP